MRSSHHRSGQPTDFEHPSSAIDYRVYVPQLMEDFQERGGELVIVPLSAWRRSSACPGATSSWQSRELDISVLVSWAFALAASTFCPMLLLGIWWTRLTARATAIGMVAGAATATGAIVAALIAGSEANDTVLAQPAVFSVPIAFATMIAVSLVGRPVPGVEVHMRALHAPEGLGLEPPPLRAS